MSNASAVNEKVHPATTRKVPTTILHMIILVVLGVAAFATSWRNTALLHHPPSTIVPAPIDDGILQGTRHFSRIFTRDFLLRTVVPDAEDGARSEYRPLGYAVFALARGGIRGDAVAAWHIFFLALHIATAILVYALLRSLVGAGSALGLSALYVCCPAFIPLINDPNTIYINVGLLCSALTLLTVQLFLKRGAAIWLLFATLAFVAALLTFRPALTLPAFVAALCLFSENRPRLATAILVWLALIVVTVILLGVTPWQVGLGGAVIISALGIGVRGPETSLKHWARILPFFLIIGVGMFLLMETVKPAPINALIINEVTAKSHLFEPSLPSISALMLLRMYSYIGVALILAIIAPLALFRTERSTIAIFVVLIAAFLAVTIYGNRLYRTDSAYWEGALAATPDDEGAIQYHLAVAYSADGRWTDARNLLMRMKYLAPPVSPLTADLATMLLGKAFYALGNEKLATYYCFGLAKETKASQTNKTWLMNQADVAIQMGYISCAEYCWANALIGDPYDLELSNNLGRALLYKNFFRSANRYFAYVTSLDLGNETALYYQAFIAKLSKDERNFEHFQRAWQKAAQSNVPIDFQPIYDRYARFDAKKYKSWISEVPFELRPDPIENSTYTVSHLEREYSFPEVPLEVGKFMASCGIGELQVNNPTDAAKYFLVAAHYLRISYNIHPARETAQTLIEVYGQLNQPDEVQRYENLLETIQDEN